MAWTAPRTWVAGEVVTAAIMNAHVRDNFLAVGDDYETFTTSWLGTTTNPTIGNGSIVTGKRVAGKNVDFRIQVNFGSTTGLGSGAYQFTLPSAAQAGFASPFLAVLVASTPGRLTRMGYLSNSTITTFCDQAGSNLTSTSAAWANGTVFAIHGRYEAA